MFHDITQQIKIHNHHIIKTINRILDGLRRKFQHVLRQPIRLKYSNVFSVEGRDYGGAS
jgi:hypothetical protein